MRLPSIPALDPNRLPALQAHQDDLTKPQGALGRLESVGVRLAWIAGQAKPQDPAAYLLTFAGDHGIAKHGVSAYPAEVTPQMVANLAMGGAASSVLCRLHHIEHRVIDVGVAVPCDFPGVIQRNVLRGTHDPLLGPSMSRADAAACVMVGVEEVMKLPNQGFSLLALGEMGIANSAVAAMLVSVFAPMSPREAVGPGTGVSGDALAHKIDVVRRVLELHRPEAADPIGALASVGGCEFGAMAGAMIAGASRGWAVIVDGYIASAAALLAIELDPKVKDYLIWSHRSAEPGAAKLLTKMDIEPLLDLGMRLGEGSGAALAVPILRSACAVMREMATFSSAGVSGREAAAQA